MLAPLDAQRRAAQIFGTSAGQIITIRRLMPGMELHRDKLLILVVGPVAFFTHVLLMGFYVANLAPTHVWVAGVAANYRALAVFVALMFDFLVVTIPVCSLFGVSYGFSWSRHPLVRALAIGLVYVLAEWIHFCFLFESMPPFSPAMAATYFAQDASVILIFLLSVYCGSSWKKASNRMFPPA